MESEKSIVLDILGIGNRVLQRVGGVFTLAGVATVVGVMGSGEYFALPLASKHANVRRRCVHHVDWLRRLGSQAVYRQRVRPPSRSNPI